MSDMFMQRLKTDLPKVWARLLHHNVGKNPSDVLKDLDEAVEAVTNKDCDIVAKTSTPKEFKDATEKAIAYLVKKRRIPMMVGE